MCADFHRPVRMPGRAFDYLPGGDDPAVAHRIAHDTAWALLARVRAGSSPEVVDRLVGYADEHGLDVLAELWSRAGARSLAGALWRLYLLRQLVVADPEGISFAYGRGVEELDSSDAVVAGAASPTGPEEIAELADTILRGAFEGDFGVALDRASAYCRVMSAGNTSLADDSDASNAERATELTTRALRYDGFAGELREAAYAWRHGTLG